MSLGPITNSTPRVRVFVRSCNRRHYLKSALDSLLAQTCDDFDVVIIDDASTDGAADVARAYASALPDRFTAVVKPVRRGLLDSIEISLKMTGSREYVAFMDDDDPWHPEKLSRQLAEFDREDAPGIVATQALIIDELGQETGERFSDLYGSPETQDLVKALFKANFLCASSVLVRSSALELVREHYDGFRGSCFDMYMWIVVAAHCGVRWLDEPLTYYRRTPGSISERRADEMTRETQVLREYAFDRFPAVRAKVGEKAGDERIREDALFRAIWNLQRRNLREYLWFSRQLLQRRSLRWSGIWLWVSVRTAAVIIVRGLLGRPVSEAAE
jgi:glycosyltransferase involved in cell wall biosynthesis